MPASTVEPETSTSDPWDRQPNEPNRWYHRFDTYRLIGPRRSIEQAFALCKDGDKLSAGRPGAAWYRTAQCWNWQQRAESWDEHERQRLRELESQRREDARNERIDRIAAVLAAAFHRLLPALQPPADADLTALRLIFRDMLNQQRTELPAEIGENHDTAIEITADDLLAAQERLEEWRAAVQEQRTCPQ